MPNEYSKILGSTLPSRIVYETDNFFMISSLGQFVKDYLLIFTKKHFSCIGQLSNELLIELLEVKNKMITVLQETYGSITIFEHGVFTRNNKKLSCINHVHLVPFTLDLNDDLEKILPHYIKIDKINELRELTKLNNQYIYYESCFGEKRIYLAEKIESQLLRKLIANSSGVAEKWDWRIYPETHNLLHTYNKISRKIKDC